METMAFASALPLQAPAGAAVRSASCAARPAPRMGPWKKGEKDEAYQQQQEILARRRNKQKNKEYFDGVEKRRQDLEEYRSERTLKPVEGEDPLIKWKEMKANGFIDEAGYPDEAPGGAASGGIPLPMASFGIPKYDQGGRFDLKLPHADVGYEDESADVMSKIGKMFGFGKKDKKPASKDTPTAKEPPAAKDPPAGGQ